MNKLVFFCLLTLCFVACQTEKSDNLIVKTVHDNWVFKEIGGTHSGTATVPGTIHTDLLANKLIEDSFYRINEKQQQWIDKKDWVYSTTLNITAEEFEKDNIVLDFEGLDTYADVYLNDSLLLQANNMFRSWEIDIKISAKKGDNILKVVLHSPIKKGLELLNASPYSYPANNDQAKNGGLEDEKVSVFTRKAGYHYGWDWGPRLVTSGIWRPVVLRSWDNVRITDVFVKQTKVTKASAELVFDIELDINESFLGRVNITNQNGEITYAASNLDLKSGIQKVSIPVSIANPKLWWSNGLGDPNMYDFIVHVLDQGDNQIFEKEIATGLRDLKLVREKDADGESFLFELNGVPVFIKGANYIPNDSFLPRVTKDDYKKVVDDAVNANMNMLRVWGGGIYEDDYFYTLCDKNGLLVWQDFMFACAMYPGNTAFLENIKQEAIDNVIRLRNHPSIALWCGNNEINWAWAPGSEKEGWGWKKRYTKRQQEALTKTYLEIFHRILPSVVKNYTDGDDYWPSSPQAGYDPEKSASYENSSGDMHYWGVWHGEHPFTDFEKYKARFMSEYGFQSFPDFQTVKKYTLPGDYNIESEVMTSHQRSGIGNLRIKQYMEKSYKVPSKFEDFLYVSQVLQASGIKMAIEAHRRAMPYCMGTMFWQINDCWPVASWSSTDYYHKWKAMHYITKKAYEPVILTVHQVKEELIVYVISDKLDDLSRQLKLSLLDFKGKTLFTKVLDVVVKKNTSTELFKIMKSVLIKDFDAKGIVLKVELMQSGTSPTLQNFYYFEKPKALKLEKPNVETEIFEKNGQQYLKVSTDKLVKDLSINFRNQKVFLSDNYFDLFPNETKVVEVTTDEILNKENLVLQHIQQSRGDSEL